MNEITGMFIRKAADGYKKVNLCKKTRIR